MGLAAIELFEVEAAQAQVELNESERLVAAVAFVEHEQLHAQQDGLLDLHQLVEVSASASASTCASESLAECRVVIATLLDSDGRRR